MASFVIEPNDAMRGSYRIDKLQVIRDAATDLVGNTADAPEYHAAVARFIVTDLLKPRRAETSRAHFLTLWPLLQEMASEAPASFDHIILEFAEHLAGFR